MDSFFNINSLYGDGVIEDETDIQNESICKNKILYSKFLQYLNIKTNDDLVIMFNKFVFSSKMKNITA